MNEPTLFDQVAGQPNGAQAGNHASSHGSAPGRAPPGFRGRARAASIHAAIGAAVLGLVMAVVFLGWYRAPLAGASGVGPIAGLLLAVDLVLGPVLTFAVFDPRKRSLRFDLALIATLQLAGLGYGVHALDAGRPAWLVFAKDRFEMVAKADLRSEDRQAASDNESARPDWLGPKIVAVASPEDPQEQLRALMEAITGGRDLQHRPDLYRPFDSQRDEARRRARPLSELRAIDAAQAAQIDAAVAATGLPEERLGFLPIRGPSADLAMLLDTRDGRPLAIARARPWR